MTDLPDRVRRYQGDDLRRYVTRVDWLFIAAVAGLGFVVWRLW